MNQPVVLDTDALIRLFRGASDDVKKVVTGASRIVIPLVVCGEFKTGIAANGLRRSPEAELFREFLAVPNTSVHRPSEVTAEYYAKIFDYLKKKRCPIPTNNIWIAAETMEIGGRLCSCDSRFAEVPMLCWTYCK